VRQRIEQIVLEGFEGRKVESYVQISGSNHARVHVVVRTDPEQRRKVDFAAIENKIARKRLSPGPTGCAKCWPSARGEAAGLLLATRYRRAFPMAYEEDVVPADALQDLADLEALREQPQAMRLKLHRPAQAKAERVHLKIVKLGDPVPISDLLPSWRTSASGSSPSAPYELVWPEGGAAWIQDFELEHRERLDIDDPNLEPTSRTLSPPPGAGEVENDGFNRLLFGCGLNAREITGTARLLPLPPANRRAVSARHIWSARWLPTPPSRASLVRLFESHFDPATAGKAAGAVTKPATGRNGPPTARSQPRLPTKAASATPIS